jgi:hypothetical protein
MAERNAVKTRKDLNIYNYTLNDLLDDLYRIEANADAAAAEKATNLKEENA